MIRAIEKREDLFDDDSPLQLSTDEKTDILDRLNGDIYSQVRIRTPVLLRFDSIVGEDGGNVQHPIVSIERVLPQSPADDSQWMTWFPDEEQRLRWTHRIANLVLLSRRKISRASNYEFDHKKSEYFQRRGTTTLPLTTQVVNESEWTPTVLERRQRELVGALRKSWRL